MLLCLHCAVFLLETLLANGFIYINKVIVWYVSLYREHYFCVSGMFSLSSSFLDCFKLLFVLGGYLGA